MGCPVDDVDAKVIQESLASLTVEEMAKDGVMDFKQFQAAKEWCDDLNARFPDDVLLGSSTRLYRSTWRADNSTF